MGAGMSAGMGMGMGMGMGKSGMEMTTEMEEIDAGGRRGGPGNRERTLSEIKHEELDHLNKWVFMYAKIIARRPRLCLLISSRK